MLKKVTPKIRGKYQKFIATYGADNSIVFSSNPTAIAEAAREGIIFTSIVITRIIDKNSKNIFAEKRDLCLA